MQLIILRGAPGCGKTTVAGLLHQHFGSPWFEFGWIPEFRKLNPHTEMSYEQEEVMTFETLTIVVKNYIRHGFENIILSDLNDARFAELSTVFAGLNYRIITLYTEDDTILKTRILNRDNGNEYRDWESAVKINQAIKMSPLLPSEHRISTDDRMPEDIVSEILTLCKEELQHG